MPPMEGKKSAWGKPSGNPSAMSNAPLPAKKDGAPARPGAGSGPGSMHQAPNSVSGPDGGKGPRPVTGGYARKPDGVPMRRKETSPDREGFVEELYTTRLDPNKLSEQQKKEAARIAAEIEEERNRKAGGRGGGFAGARGPQRKFNWGEYEDDDLDVGPANDAPPPPVHSATAFPALDSRPREPAISTSQAPLPTSQEPPQPNNAAPPGASMPPPAVSNPAMAQTQFPQGGQNMQQLPPQDAAVTYPIANSSADSSNAPNAPTNAVDGSAAPSNSNAAMGMGKPGESSGEPQLNNTNTNNHQSMLQNMPPPNPSSMLGMPPFMAVPGRPPLPSSVATTPSQFGLPMFGEGGATEQGALGEQGGKNEGSGAGAGPGGMMGPPNLDPNRSPPFPPLGGEALSMYLEHPENSALHAFIVKDYQFKVSMRQEVAVLQERLKESDRARESAERLVKQLEREKSVLAQEKISLEKQLDAQSASDGGASGNQHLLETVERLREDLARAHESLRNSEDRERQVYHLLEREKMQVQSFVNHRESNFFQMLHQQETRIQQQEARIQDLQRHNHHLSSQMQGRSDESDPNNKSPPPVEGSGAGGPPGTGSQPPIDSGAPPGLSSLGMGGMGGFNLHQMSMQMQHMQLHHQNQGLPMQMGPQPGQMMNPNQMPPPPQQQQQPQRPPAPAQQQPPKGQPPQQQQQQQPPPPPQGQVPPQANMNGPSMPQEGEQGSAVPQPMPSQPQGQPDASPAPQQPYYAANEGGQYAGWQGGGVPPGQSDGGEARGGPWPMPAGGAAPAVPEDGAKQQQAARGPGVGNAPPPQQQQQPPQQQPPPQKTAGGRAADAEALVNRKRELLALKKNVGHHEFFDLDNMTSPQLIARGRKVEAAIKRIHEQYGQGGRQGGRQVRGAEQGRSTQNVPGEEWEVVQPTKKGQQGNRMVDEKRVGTFTLHDKSGIISGNLLQGLLLYHNVLQASEEQALVEFVAEQIQRGKRRELAGTTYVAAQRSNKRCAQLQYGISYNYAEQTVGGSQVEALPAILSQLAEKLITEGIIHPSQRPNTAVVSIFEEGDCLPPHVDSKDFSRPVCSLSLSASVDMCFGDKAGRIDVASGGMDGFPVNFPRRSALVLQDGLCANDVQHGVGPVKSRWTMVTLRRH